MTASNHAVQPHEYLSSFLARLREANIHHTLRGTRDDAIVSVDVSVPRERCEIDFPNGGSVDVEVFRSDGTMHAESKFDELFADFAD